MTQTRPRVCFLLSACFLLVGLLTEPANAQSTDVGNPTPLSSNSIKGNLEKRVNNFYTFQAGPGEVSAALFVEACPGGCIAQANLQLLSADGVTRLCKSVSLTSVNGETTQGACTAQLSRRQTVLLRIGLAGGGAKSTYQVRVTGSAGSDGGAREGAAVAGATNGFRRMIITMKDGSVQEIELSKVSGITFQ
jgi:hypothetical protein